MEPTMRTRDDMPWSGADLDDFLHDLTDDDLENAKADLQEDSAEIRGQIDDAKSRVWTDGKYADPVWYRRANSALRSKTVQYMACCREQGRRKKARSSDPGSYARVVLPNNVSYLTDPHFAVAFKVAAKELLTGELYAQVIARTRQIIEGMEEATEGATT